MTHPDPKLDDVDNLATSYDDRKLRRLLRTLEAGDQILWVTGASSKSDQRTESLTVKRSATRLELAKERRDEYDLDDEVVDSVAGRRKDLKTVFVEGPRGGQYKIVENTHDRNHVASVRYSGKTGALKELALTSRDGDVEAAAEAFEAMFSESRTFDTDRPLAVCTPDPQEDVETDDAYNWLCYLDDEGRFVARPTLKTGDLHIETHRHETYGQKRKKELVFEDDYETLVEEGAKEAIKALDWDRSHATFDGDAKVWKFDRDALAYALEHIVEAGWSITVPREYGEARNAEWAVPGVGWSGRKRDEGVETLDFEDVHGETDDVAGDDDGAGGLGGKIEEEVPGERNSYEATEDGVEERYFEDLAEEHGMPVEEVKEAMAEYGVEAFGR